MIVGQHAVTNGSVMGEQVDALLSGGVDILYSDPPWGDGLLRMFATTTEKVTGVRPDQPSWLELCDRYAEIISRYVREWVFIEVGVKTYPDMLAAVRPMLSVVEIAPFKYGADLSATMIYGRVNPGPLPSIDLTGKKGLAMVEYVLGTVSGKTVADPCCGAGYTARAARKRGMTFYGNELNPARLDKTIRYLS